jgi:hypothetical protein
MNKRVGMSEVGQVRWDERGGLPPWYDFFAAFTTSLVPPRIHVACHGLGGVLKE